MKATSRIEALLQLQESLGNIATESLGDSRSALKNVNNVPIPNYESAATALMGARRIKQRSACISAEISQVAREEPSDTSTLDKEVNYFHRSFAVTKVTMADSIDPDAGEDIGFPETYSASNGNGITRNVFVENKGINYCWGKSNNAPIVLKVSLQPSSDDFNASNDNLFRQWCFPLDTIGIAMNVPEESSNINVDYKKVKMFQIILPSEDLVGLDRRAYIVRLQMYESEIADEALQTTQLDFNGEYTAPLIIQE